MKKKRRLKKSIKNILIVILGITMGIITAFRTNAEAPETNINVSEGTRLISDYEYFKRPEIIKVTLPDGLLQIGFSAFEGCKGLKHIELPDSLTAIDNRGFAKCEELAEIHIPDSVVFIGNAAFYGCNSLKKVELPKGLMAVENNMFYGCKSLSEVVLPEGIVNIGQQSFYDCEKLEKIELPQTVSVISDGAFYDCKNLKEIIMPASVSQIGLNAFEGCNNLNIIAPEGSYAYQYAKDHGFIKNNTADKEDISKVDLKVETVVQTVPKTGVNTPYEMVFIITLMSAMGLIMLELKDKKKRIIISLLGALLLSITACGQTNEEEKIVYLTEEKSASAYEFVYVQNKDVILTQTVPCSYKQTKEQEVSFGVGGKRIDKVYVHAGDEVKRGDVLAELAIGNLEEDIKKLEYEIEVKKKKKSYLDAWEDFELAESYHSLVYRSGKEEEDVKEKDERDADIKQSYADKRQDYDDELEFDNEELAKMKRELSESRIYATMNGTVLKVLDDVEGSTSKRDLVIMTIIDGTDGMFATETSTEVAENLKNADTMTLNIVYGDAKGEYIVAPYNISSWGKEQYFVIVEGPENEGIEVGTTANLTVKLDERDNVPALPKNNVYDADGKKYVYVLGDDNMKTIKWIETGLTGDEYVEIVSGLSLGEAVVRR